MRGDVSKSYGDMIHDLPEKNCCYAVINIKFDTDEGRPTSKLMFISWNTDTASVRPKMLYSGSKEAIKAALNGVGINTNTTGKRRNGGTGTNEGEGVVLHDK